MAFEPDARASWWLSATLCAIFVALPFLAVTIPPITDLPQQTAQIRLLLEALSDDPSPYRVQWLDPNNLGYLPLLAGWLAAPPLRAGGVGLMLIGWLWVASIHLLAARRGRPVAAAALATVFFWNHLLYWGLVTFLIGLPVFVLWLLLLERLPARGLRRRELAAIVVLGVLLYGAHVLWLAAGLVWLAVDALRRRLPPRGLVERAAGLAPTGVLLALWYPRFGRWQFDSETRWWDQEWLERLHPQWLLNSVLGGLRDPAVRVLAVVIVGWLLLGLWQHRRRLRRSVDGELALLAGLMVVAALVLPQVHRHTIFFASRWLPPAAVLLTLALPPPRIQPLLQRALPLLVVASLSLLTTNVWRVFEREELAGFEPALEALPPEPRLLGLDFVRQSPRILDYPFYHLYAYGQVLRGGELNRSFAEWGSSLVVYRELPRDVPWNQDLDWLAHLVRESDVDHFSHVLVFAPPPVHARLAADPDLVPVTDDDLPWRLYRVARYRLAPP